jgi:sulfate permease, SulP family
MLKKATTWRLTRWDVAGAWGDIGILFPIAMALISLNQVNPTAAFLAAGLAYILAGTYFRIPMPVQPFKAVAAIALALHLAPSSIASAGLLMGLLLALVGVTNLVTPLARLFTLPIVRGIQLGLGLILLREGLRLSFGPKYGTLLAGGLPIDGWEVAVTGLIVLLLLRNSRRFPSALILLSAGVLLGLLANGRSLAGTGWGPLPLERLHPRAGELGKVLFALVLPQFALTFGNSIVATQNTARLLYGSQASRVTVRALSIGIGVMNLASSAFMAPPTCHGSGGVTAHYQFGARSAKSSYVIGAACLGLALAGGGTVRLLHLIPTALLGVFLVYVGVQHGALVRDIIGNRSHLFIAVCTGLMSLAKSNLTYGFAVGFAIQGLFAAAAKARKRLCYNQGRWPAQPTSSAHD